MKRSARISSPIGFLTVTEDEYGISEVLFGADSTLPAPFSPLLINAAQQLEEYFSGTRKTFDLPLSLHGTDFQKSVWRALMDIPYGETRTYKEIAEMIDNPNACRAVGMANNRNKLPIIIPCHRVIGTGGKLVGYAGGLEIKEFLLELEKKE